MFAAKHFGGGADANILSAVAAVTSGSPVSRVCFRNFAISPTPGITNRNVCDRTRWRRRLVLWPCGCTSTPSSLLIRARSSPEIALRCLRHRRDQAPSATSRCVAVSLLVMLVVIVRESVYVRVRAHVFARVRVDGRLKRNITGTHRVRNAALERCCARTGGRRGSARRRCCCAGIIIWRRRVPPHRSALLLLISSLPRTLTPPLLLRSLPELFWSFRPHCLSGPRLVHLALFHPSLSIPPPALPHLPTKPAACRNGRATLALVPWL